MKTIPVSFLVAGMLLPVVCLAQPPGPPRPSGEWKGDHREQPRPMDVKTPADNKNDGTPGEWKGDHREQLRPIEGRKPADTDRGGPPGEWKGDHREQPRPMEGWKPADSDHDGLVSKAEFDAMPRIQNLPEEKREEIFNRLDKDADGKLSRGELERGDKPNGGPGQPMKGLWELDADKNGGISFEEFKVGQLFAKLPAEKQVEVFHRLDTDGDGVITPKDRPEPPFKNTDGKPHTWRGEGERPDAGGERGQINRKLDLDGDGALSFEEFRQSPPLKNLTEEQQRDRFELIDRNVDHKISEEDFAPPPPPKVDGPPPAPIEGK